MRVLLVGETWVVHSTHVKGFDSFTTSEYGDGSRFLVDALRAGGVEVEHLPAHLVPDSMPDSVEELGAWDVVILSDIGANSLVLSNAIFKDGRSAPNRLDVLEQWVVEGGALVMCGGYMSFAGIEGKAAFHRTPVEHALGITISSTDDRVENPSKTPCVAVTDHPLTAGFPAAWPSVLGYNRITAGGGCEVLVTIGDDPFVTVAEHGKGRALAWTSDVGPHWAPEELVTSDVYREFWPKAVRWLCRK